MCRILILRRATGEQLYSLYTVDGEVFTTDDDAMLTDTIKGLLETKMPRNNFIVVKDVDCEIDVLLGATV